MLCVPWEVSRSEVELEECRFVAAPVLSNRHPELDAAKAKVGVFKAKHGDMRWKENVASVDRNVTFSNVTDRPISRAYFKLVEILRTTAVKPPDSSLHLCEAPGGFAQAVITEDIDDINCNNNVFKNNSNKGKRRQ